MDSTRKFSLHTEEPRNKSLSRRWQGSATEPCVEALLNRGEIRGFTRKIDRFSPASLEFHAHPPEEQTAPCPPVELREGTAGGLRRAQGFSINGATVPQMCRSRRAKRQKTGRPG